MINRILAYCILTVTVFAQCGVTSNTNGVLPCGNLDPFGLLGAPYTAALPSSYTVYLPSDQTNWIGVDNSTAFISSTILPDDTITFILEIDNININAAINASILTNYSYLFLFLHEYNALSPGLNIVEDIEYIPIVEWELNSNIWIFNNLTGKWRTTLSVRISGFYPFASLRFRNLYFQFFMAIPTSSSYIGITSIPPLMRFI